MMRIKEVNRLSMKVFNAVLRLLPQLDPDSALPTRKHFEKMLKSEQIHFFTAELDNKIVGMLTIATYHIPSGTKFWIEDVIVDELHRGKGIGKELMLFAINYAKSMGARSVELTSRPFRIEANQLYTRLGFVLRETNVYRHSFTTSA